MLRGNPDRKRAVYILAMLAVAYLFFFYHLGDYSLKEPDEGRYAEIPREMIEQGDYLVPHLDYVRYFEKPPLLYWVIAASYKVFGANEWSFRLPNALLALSCVFLTFLFAARWFTNRVALISSIMLMTSFGFFALARIVTVDMLFSVLLFAALLCFYEFYREKRAVFLFLFFAAAALAVLAKGPVALVLLGATIVLFLYSEKRLSFLKEMASVKGLLLFGAITAPWFVLISLKEKEFFQFFFVDQHVLRFLTTKHNRSGPPYYFFPVLFGGLFPWSLFIPRAVVRLWRVREMRLFFLWSLVVFTFFSVSGSKLPPYILPIFPALSLILGSLFDGQWQRPVPLRGELIAYLVFFSCLALAGIIYGSGLLDGYLAGAPDLIALSHDVAGLSLGMAVVSVIVFLILAVRRMRSFGALFFVLAAFSVSVALGLLLHVRVIDGLNSTKGLAQAITGMHSACPIVVNYGSFDETLPFYLGRKTYLAAFTGELEMGSLYGDSKGSFLNDDEFARLFASGKPVVAVLKEKRLDRLKALGIDWADMICQDTRCLITNRSAGAVATIGTPTTWVPGRPLRGQSCRSLPLIKRKGRRRKKAAVGSRRPLREQSTTRFATPTSWVPPASPSRAFKVSGLNAPVGHG